MLTKFEGKISSYKAVTKNNVQFELQGINKIIELTISEPWVINRCDYVVVAGEENKKTGKFVGYAYRNMTKGVFGKFNPGVFGGYFFVLLGLIFCWAIFPLFIHVPVGLRVIALGRKINQAAAML